MPDAFTETGQTCDSPASIGLCFPFTEQVVEGAVPLGVEAGLQLVAKGCQGCVVTGQLLLVSEGAQPFDPGQQLLAETVSVLKMARPIYCCGDDW